MIFFFFLRSSVLCLGGYTVTLAEEQPLPKEWHLPPDISFIFGKLAKKRWSQTLLVVAMRKHKRQQP